MDDYSHYALSKDSASFTESMTLLRGTISSISIFIIDEDPIVALPSRATIRLSDLHFTQANLGLQTLESPELLSTYDRLPTEQLTELVSRPVHHGLPTPESVLRRGEQYTPHIVLPMVTGYSVRPFRVDNQRGRVASSTGGFNRYQTRNNTLTRLGGINGDRRDTPKGTFRICLSWV